MKLNVQKRVAAGVLKCSPKRVVFDSDRLDEIKEAITKSDLRGLISDRAIVKKSIKGTSKVEHGKDKHKNEKDVKEDWVQEKEHKTQEIQRKKYG